MAWASCHQHLAPAFYQLTKCLLSTDITRKDNKGYTTVTTRLLIASPERHSRRRLAYDRSPLNVQALSRSIRGSDTALDTLAFDRTV